MHDAIPCTGTFRLVERLIGMEAGAIRQDLEQRLERCVELAREFTDGSMGETLRDVEVELREQLRELEQLEIDRP